MNKINAKIKPNVYKVVFLRMAFMAKTDEDVDIRSLPQRKITDVEKQFIFLETQRLRLRRESAVLILDKGVFLFLTSLAIGMFAVVNKIIHSNTLNLIVIIGLAALIISVMPYQSAIKKEEAKIEKMINNLLR